MSEEKLEAIVIGSGFGGAISALRLSMEWPGRVLVLERGRRYPIGSFPRSPQAFSRNLWNVPLEDRPPWWRRLWQRMTLTSPIMDQEIHGMFDVRSYRHMDVVQAAGLGGGSLIYANVFLFPPRELFADQRWPATCKWDDLHPYYQVAKSIVGSRPLPGYAPNEPSVVPQDPRRRVLRTEMFRKVAPGLGRDSHLAEINVFFGNDDEPLEIGVQEKNRFGKTQTSCVYCGECMIGCNTHSKNTLDLNYLHVAEHHYKAEIRTEHLVEAIVPLDSAGQDSTTANGDHGYRVYYWDVSKHDLASQRGRISHYTDLPSLVAKRVIVSAGSLGSTELLLRNKFVHKTLQGISPKLGESFSGNGDFLNFGLRPAAELDANYGPVITQYTDYNLYRDFDRDRAFLVEDAAYPPIVGWFLEGFRPAFSRIPTLAYTLVDLLKRVTTGTNVGRVGNIFRQVLGETFSDNAVIYLNMGVDRSDGTMSLGEDGRLRMNWPYRNSRTLYRAIIGAGAEISRRIWARVFFPLLTWSWPFRRNITVHPLGGCALGTDETNGVTNANRDRFAEVFGYRGLYVIDGAILPTGVGSNPTATISALSEMAAEGITGRKPTGEILPDQEASAVRK